MATSTPAEYRNMTIYGVNVRCHGSTGTFSDVAQDLERISSMGVEVIWLLPIHPVGIRNRKGSLGSSYSIRNYREIAEEYGGIEEFTRLLDSAHTKGLKIMMDVVFNHCSIDSDVARAHVDWFYREPNGELYVAKEGWTDVVGFNYEKPNPERDEYLIGCLCKWASMGVDGFRCDFASAIPLEFWRRAREEIDKINPEVIWLAESVHAGIVAQRRNRYLPISSDCELYSVFDIAYDYDIWPIWQASVNGIAPLKRYCEMLRYQDSIYPGHYVKLRSVENHDHSRIMDIVEPNRALAWTAFQAFNKGAFLINAGQESGESKRLSLLSQSASQNYAL